MDGMVNGLGIVYTPHQCWYSDRKSPYWEKIPKVPLGVLGTSITMQNTLPSWLYQCLTLRTTFGPFQHLSGVKHAILPLKRPFARGRTILHILNWLKTRPKAANASN